MLWIEVEVGPGESIDNAAQEAVRLAGAIGVGVKFPFNGIMCYAGPRDAPDSVVRHFLREIDRPDSMFRVDRG